MGWRRGGGAGRREVGGGRRKGAGGPLGRQVDSDPGGRRACRTMQLEEREYPTPCFKRGAQREALTWSRRAPGRQGRMRGARCS